MVLIAGCSKPEEVISRRLTQANQNLEAGQVDEAIKTLEKLNQTYIDQPAVLEALGFAYARAGQHLAAATSFQRAVDHDPRSVSLRLLAAESFALADEPGRAAEQHRVYLAEVPGDYHSREQLGEIEEKNGDLARALDEYIECYRLHPTGEYAWRIGNVFRRLNNAPQTKVWFETTIKHAETHVEEALLGLLELELNARDFAAAERTIGLLDRNYPGALDKSPLARARDDLAAWRETQLGLQTARGMQERAAREIQEERRRQEAEITSAAPPATVAPQPQSLPAAPASEPAAATSAPASAPSNTVPATAASASTTPAENDAAATPMTAVAAVPEGELARPLPPDLLAALELKDRGLHEQAIARLWNIIVADDARVDAWLELGQCYRAMNKLGDAESCLLEASRRAPDDLEITIAYLEVVRESQSRDVYLARLESARRKFPSDANLAYFSARELAAIDGATARAINAYEDFLLLAPPDDGRRREAANFLTRARGY